MSVTSRVNAVTLSSVRDRLAHQRETLLEFLVACAGLAVLAVAIAPFAMTVTDPYPHHQGWNSLFSLLACGPVLLLRRHALVVFAFVASATAVVIASGAEPLTLCATLGVATFCAACRRSRRQSVPVTVVIAIVLGAALIFAAFNSPFAEIGIQSVEVTFALLAGWFFGDTVSVRRRYLAEHTINEQRERMIEADRARRAIQDERLRIARELHDIVAHSLAIITVQAGVGRRLMTEHPERAGEALGSIEEIGRSTHDELQVVLGLLREDGAAAELTPAPGLTDLNELIETVRLSGTPVELITTGPDQKLSPLLELSIFRLVQEALTNVVKHAPGSNATITVAVSPASVEIEVVNGHSPLANQASFNHVESIEPGHGITGMRERVGALGGSLIAEPLCDHGFRVLAEIPVAGTA